jgi:nucleoside phosphorylase
MSELVRSMILVVAATPRELAVPGSDGWRTLCCGVGPVESAAATAAAIARHAPAAVLHVGVAGARRQRALVPGTVVIGSEARYWDLPADLPAEWAARSVLAAPELVAAAQRVVPDALVLPIGTSARVGGTSDHAGCDVEAMEGFGVLRAAQLAGVPAVEVRVVSNDIEEADRARWRLDDGFAAITALTPRLVAELLSCVS